MMPPLLPKQTLQIINNKALHYTPVIAEKDYFLTLVSKIVHESPLGKKLVFKGGTAIHHCYLPQLRFSEDLDFTSLDRDLTVDEVRAVFNPYPFLEVKEVYVSKSTIKLQRLKYSGILDTPNSLKLEIDFIQNVVLPAETRPYTNVWGIDTSVHVMNIKEICAEKMRAMSDRARFRDFFDFYFLMQHYHLDMTEVVTLLQQKEIRKPVTQESMLANLRTALERKDDELKLIAYRGAPVDYEKIRQLIEHLDFEPIPSNSVFQKAKKSDAEE